MCRMYGFRGQTAVLAAPDLLESRHALLGQSRQDRKGRAHPDGWGIGYYVEGRPQAARGAGPPYEDPGFRAAAEHLASHTVIAHVRDASVGVRSLANTHPFCHGPWLFAHNGTVTAFEHVAPALEAETPAELLQYRQGGTDSELVFYWLLGRLSEVGVEAGRANPLPLARNLGEAIIELAARCERAGAAEPAKLTVLITDGMVMVASRWGHALHWLERSPGQAVVVASEPTDEAAWREVPERSVLAITASLDLSLHALPWSAT